jgi:hypothetical protein
MTTIAQARAALVTAVGAVDAEGTAAACYVFSGGTDMERLGQTGVEWEFRVTCAVGLRGTLSTGSAELAAYVAGKLATLNALAGWRIVRVSPDGGRTIGGGEQLAADIIVSTKVDI